MTSVPKHEVLSKRRSNQFVHPDKAPRTDGQSDKPSRTDGPKTQTDKLPVTRIPRNNTRVLGQRSKTSKDIGNKLKSKDIFKYTEDFKTDEPKLVGDSKQSKPQSVIKNEQIKSNESIINGGITSETDVFEQDNVTQQETCSAEQKEMSKETGTNNKTDSDSLDVKKQGDANDSHVTNGPENLLNRSDQENICLEKKENEQNDNQTVTDKSKSQESSVQDKTVKRNVLCERSSTKPTSKLPRTQTQANRSQSAKVKTEIQSKQNSKTSLTATASASTATIKVRRSKSNTPSDDNKNENNHEQSQTRSGSTFNKTSIQSRKTVSASALPRRTPADRDANINKQQSVNKTVNKDTESKSKRSDSKLKTSNEFAKSVTKPKTTSKLSEKSLNKHNQTFSNDDKEGNKSKKELESKNNSSMESSYHSNVTSGSSDHVTFTKDVDNKTSEVNTKKSRTIKRNVSVTETRTSVMRRSRSRSVTPGASSVSSESSHSNKSTSSSRTNSSKSAEIPKTKGIGQRVRPETNTNVTQKNNIEKVQSKAKSSTKSVGAVKSYMRQTESMRNKQSCVQENTTNPSGMVKRQISNERSGSQKHMQEKQNPMQKYDSKSNHESVVSAKKEVSTEKVDSKGSNTIKEKRRENTDSLPSIKCAKQESAAMKAVPRKSAVLVGNSQDSKISSTVKRQISNPSESKQKDAKISTTKFTNVHSGKLERREKCENVQTSNLTVNKPSIKQNLSAIKSTECKNNSENRSKLITPLPGNVSSRASKVSKQNLRSVSTKSDSHVNSRSGKSRIAHQDSNSKQLTSHTSKHVKQNPDSLKKCDDKNTGINNKGMDKTGEDNIYPDRSENNEQYFDMDVSSHKTQISSQEKKSLFVAGNSACVNTGRLLECGELDSSENNIVLLEKSSKNGNQCETGEISEFFPSTEPSSNSWDMHFMKQARDRFEVMNDKNLVTMETVCAIAPACSGKNENGQRSVVSIDKISRTVSDRQLSNSGENAENTQNGTYSESPILIQEGQSLENAEIHGHFHGENDNRKSNSCGFDNSVKCADSNETGNESELCDKLLISGNNFDNKTRDKNVINDRQTDGFNTTCDTSPSVITSRSAKMDVNETCSETMEESGILNDSEINLDLTDQKNEQHIFTDANDDVQKVEQTSQNEFERTENTRLSASHSVQVNEKCSEYIQENEKIISTKQHDSGFSEFDTDETQCSTENIGDNTNLDQNIMYESSQNKNQNKKYQSDGSPIDSPIAKGFNIYSKINEDERTNSYILIDSGGALRHQESDEGCVSQQNDNKNDKDENIKFCYTGAPVYCSTDKSQTETQKLDSQSILCGDGNNDKSLSDNSQSLSNQFPGESLNKDKGMQDDLDCTKNISEQSNIVGRDSGSCHLKSEFEQIGNDGTCFKMQEDNENCCQATSENPEVHQTFTGNKIEENDKQKILSLVDNNSDNFSEFYEKEKENNALNCPALSASSQSDIKLTRQDDHKMSENLELSRDYSAISGEMAEELCVHGADKDMGSQYSNSGLGNESESFRDKDISSDVMVITTTNREIRENSTLQNKDNVDFCISSELELSNSCQSCSNENEKENKNTNDLQNYPTESGCAQKRCDFGIDYVISENSMDNLTLKKDKNENNDPCSQKGDVSCVENDSTNYDNFLSEGTEFQTKSESGSKNIITGDLSLENQNSNNDLCNNSIQNPMPSLPIMQNAHQCNMVQKDIKIDECTSARDNEAQISQNVGYLCLDNGCSSKTVQNLHCSNVCGEKIGKSDSDSEITFLESKNKCNVVKIARQQDSPSCRAEGPGKIKEFESSEQNTCSYQNTYQKCEIAQENFLTISTSCNNNTNDSNDCISEQDISSDFSSPAQNRELCQNDSDLDHKSLNECLFYENRHKHRSETVSSADHLSRSEDREFLQKEITLEHSEIDLPNEHPQFSIITQMNINRNLTDQRGNENTLNMEKLACGSAECNFDRDLPEHARESARDLESPRDLCVIGLTDSDNRCENKTYNPTIHQDFPRDEMSGLSRVEFISQTPGCNQIVSETPTLPPHLPELNSTDQNSNTTRVICYGEADKLTCASHSQNTSDSTESQKGSHDLKLECVYNSQTITPGSSSNSSDVIKGFNFKANDGGNQCNNFDGNQSVSLDTVQQGSDYQFNKTQTFDVLRSEVLDKNACSLPGLTDFSCVNEEQNVLDYDAVDGQIFDKSEIVQQNYVGKGENDSLCDSVLTESKTGHCFGDVTSTDRNCVTEIGQRRNSATDLDLQYNDQTDIIGCNLQGLSPSLKSDTERVFCFSEKGPNFEFNKIYLLSENQTVSKSDGNLNKDCPAFPRKSKFIKSSSVSNLRTSTNEDFLYKDTKLHCDITQTQRHIPFKNVCDSASNKVCDNAGEALCDNVSDITDIFEDSGDNYVDAEETFDTDIDTTDIDITNSSSCASDLYKQDETLQESEITDVETDVNSEVVIDVTVGGDNSEDNVNPDVYKCRESLTSTESFQDAFDNFVEECTQTSTSSDKILENENFMLQVSPSLSNTSQTTFEDSEDVHLNQQISILGDTEEVTSTTDDMERRRRREVSAVTTIVTGSTVSQHVRAAEFRNSSAIKDNVYQRNTSSNLKENQHIIQSRVLRSTDSSRNESGQKVIENVVHKTGNRELPQVLCSIAATGEKQTNQSQTQRQPDSLKQSHSISGDVKKDVNFVTSNNYVVSEYKDVSDVTKNDVDSRFETTLLKSEMSSSYNVQTDMQSTEISNAASSITHTEKVERKIETAVTIRTERRRRRQIQKTATESETNEQFNTGISVQTPEEGTMNENLKIERDNTVIISSRSKDVTFEGESVSVFVDHGTKTPSSSLNDSNQTSCSIENDYESIHFNPILKSDPENVLSNKQSTNVESVVNIGFISVNEKEIVKSENVSSNDVQCEIQTDSAITDRNEPTVTCISCDGNTIESAEALESEPTDEPTFTINVQTLPNTVKYDELDDIDFIDTDDIPEVDKSTTEGQHEGKIDTIEGKDESPNASFTLTFEIASDDESHAIDIVCNNGENKDEDGRSDNSEGSKDTDGAQAIENVCNHNNDNVENKQVDYSKVNTDKREAQTIDIVCVAETNESENDTDGSSKVSTDDTSFLVSEEPNSSTQELPINKTEQDILEERHIQFVTEGTRDKSEPLDTPIEKSNVLVSDDLKTNDNTVSDKSYAVEIQIETLSESPSVDEVSSCSQGTDKENYELDYSESTISEESNISVALALKLEREKLNEFNNNGVNAEDCSRSRSRICQSKRNIRSASTGNFVLQLQTSESDNTEMFSNIKAGLSRRSLKKSSSFRIDRQNAYSPVDDGSVEENMDTLKNAGKKVTDICRSFVQKARSSSRPREEEGGEKRVISPTPQRKLMKWVNAKGKWLRIPVNETLSDDIVTKEEKDESSEIECKSEQVATNEEIQQSSKHEVKKSIEQINVDTNSISVPEKEANVDTVNVEELSEEKKSSVVDIKDDHVETKKEMLDKTLKAREQNVVDKGTDDQLQEACPSSVNESQSKAISNGDAMFETENLDANVDSKPNNDISPVETAVLEVGPKVVYSPTKTKPKLHLDITKANDQIKVMAPDSQRPSTAPVKAQIKEPEFPVMDKNDFLLGIGDSVSRRKLVKMLSPTRSPISTPTLENPVGQNGNNITTEKAITPPRRIPKLTAVKIQEEIFEGKPEYMKECNIDPLGMVSEKSEIPLSTVSEHRKSRQFKDIKKSHTFTSLEDAKYSRDKSPNSAESVDNLTVESVTKTVDLDADSAAAQQRSQPNAVLEPKTSGNVDKRKMKLPVMRDRSLQRPKLLSEIVEVEENKDDSQHAGNSLRSKYVQQQQQQPDNNKKERKLRKSGTGGNKRRSLSLPTGSLAFGDTRIVYKNGHFTFETMDDYKNDSSRPPDLSDEDIPGSVNGMHVTVDSSLHDHETMVYRGDARNVAENQRPGLKRQCAKAVLTKRDSDDNVFYNTDDVTAFSEQRNESYSNSSHTSEMSVDSLGSDDHENDLGDRRKGQQSSSSLPETGSSPTIKQEALRARRTSSFRRAQEAGTLSLISENDSGTKPRSATIPEVNQSSPSSQKSMPKRKTLNENMTLFSKQSESAKDFFSKRMNLKGLFKKNKPELGLPTGSPLKTQHPVSPPIAAFQGDDDIGSIDTPPSSPGPNKDFRRRHTSADIYIKSFAVASASESGSNCPTPTQERHPSYKQAMSNPTTPSRESNSLTNIRSNESVCSLEDDRISVTSASSASSSVHSVQSPAMEQPHKPKTPKPVGASPRRSHSIGSQGSRTSYHPSHRDRSSTSVTSLESDQCDNAYSDFISEGHCECDSRLSELVLRSDKKLTVDLTHLCQFCQNFLEYANSVGIIDGAKFERHRKNSSNKDISLDGHTSAKSRKDSTSRKSLEKLAIMSQTAVVSSNSNDSGIQRDVSAHSSNESIKGTQDGQVLLRRKKSPSPQTERPKSEAGVRWADLDLDASEFHQPVRLRRHAQMFKDRPRPKSDLDDSIQLFDELFDEILEDFDTEGSSFLSERMKAFGSEIDLQPYCSLRNLYDMRKRDFDKRKNRRMSTPHPIKSRLHRSPKKLQKQPPLVRSSSMPESLDKITKRRKLHLLDYHMDSLQRHMDAEDCLSDDSDLSFDHASLQERSLSIQSSQSQLTSMDEDEDNLIYAEALWDHITMVPDEIAFRAQDVIEVMDMRDKDWWYGAIDDKEGWFPAAFVRLRVNQDQIEEEDMEITLHETLTSSPKSRRISMLNKNQARTNVVNEIINAEREYVKHLKDVVEGYIQHARKRKEMFPEERIALIFGNIETIYSFAQKFLGHLEKCIDVCPHLSEIGQCFLDNERGFEVYSDYCNNHPSACEELKELCLDSKFRHFFEACRLLQELVEIPLEGFLLTPVQKICKYPLQLAELLKYTPPDHPDYVTVKDALSAMRKIATLINERKRKMESIEKIAAWQHTVVDWEGDDLLERSSELIFSGDINKVNTAGWSQERYFFLFDHQLIYCKKELLKRHVFSYKGRIDLDQCEVIDVPDGRDTQYNVSVKHGWKLHETHKDKWYLLYGKTLAVKERWLKALKDERKRVKEDRDNDFCVPDHWKQTVLNKVRSQSNLKDKHPTNRVNPAHQVPYQKDLKDFTYSTLPRRRLNSQKQDKKKGWFIFGGKKSKR